MIIKKQNYLKHAIVLFLLLLLMQPERAWAAYENVEFSSLTNHDGLTNSQVGAILKDTRGYIWFGTQSGLCRFDGFRMKTFYYINTDDKSLPNNSVDELQQDYGGNIWVHTSVGYCIYKYDEEQFERKPEEWLKNIHVQGPPYKLLIDKDKNMWIAVYGQGLYYHNAKTKNTYLFKFTKKAQPGCLKEGNISKITEVDGDALITYGDGTICRVNGQKQKVLWYNSFLATHKAAGDNGAYTFYDGIGGFWLSVSNANYVYQSKTGKWTDARSYLTNMGIDIPCPTRILMRDIARDKAGNLWVASDHNGLFFVDFKRKICRQYVHSEAKGSIVDNSLQKVYVDDEGAIWVGSYKNGVAYYSPDAQKFTTIPLGDVCTITQNLNGNLWCGTNDSGIICYSPLTGQSWRFSQAETGLASDIIVSSVTMSDGTMYFGTFNGGLAQYKNGRWKSFLAAPGGLANNSVWCLAEDPYHRLIIGTLGSGFQIYNPESGKFTTYNVQNSGITSDFINSLFLPNKDEILIGHSQNYSIFNFGTRKVTNVNKTKDGQPFPSPSLNYMMKDSRGILWMASPAGVTMYDEASGQLESINDLNGTQGTVGCMVLEDKQHNIWLVSEFIVTRVTLAKNNQGKWDITMISFNSLDGLQSRQFNQRSACLMRNGAIAIGGQDGINIINPAKILPAQKNAHVLFCGFVLFDHPLKAGEEFEGRVPLEKSLDTHPELDLSYKDKAFTIQFASDQVSIPARCRFLYRMKGLDDKWMLTPEGRPEATFTNLSSGSYVLEAKVVDADGSVSEEVSTLKIYIHPPFYLSIWAIIVYIILIGVAFYLYRKRMLEKQRVKFELQSKEDSIKKTKELNEFKLNFFTNVSHELRTPLTLIISPLVNMIREERDESKRRKLEMIHRNATRLLNLVNQILDFRKIDQNKEKLTLSRIDIVSFVDNICTSFRTLANSKVTLAFDSTMPSLQMSFDADKVGKIVNNLLSNAYKFTPDGGFITVSLSVAFRQRVGDKDSDMLRISVSDTGKGISDKEKEHVFERFYQVNGTEMQLQGGSGIGLNLVKKFAELHGGKVDVTDNPSGGTIFMVDLPIESSTTSNSTAHLGSLRAAPIITTVHQATDEDPDAGKNVLYGMSKHAHQPGESMIKKPVVLLVDDSEDFREFMNEVLTDYTVVEAVNGQDAWNKIIDRRPDIILSDVMMPVMDGNELCRMCKDNDETTAIPFIMLSARMGDEQRKESLKCGADEYIAKPFDIDMLNLCILNLLKKRKNVSTEYVITEADRKFIDEVNAYIRDHMSNPETSVELLSTHLSISRVQLYKRMISLTGITPSEYLRTKRIKFAEHLLRSDDLNISEIAYKVGFNNPRYFTKYFQDAYGVTPSQYRKNLSESE